MDDFEIDKDDTIEGAIDKYIVANDDVLIKLEDVLEPQYMKPENCPAEDRCRCKDENYCTIEEAIAIEITKEYLSQGRDLRDKLVLSRLIDSHILAYRLRKLGGQINYRRVGNDPEYLKLLDKYVSMTTKIQRSARSDEKELLMTAKERSKLRKDERDATVELAMSKLRELDEKEEAVEKLEEVKDEQE